MFCRNCGNPMAETDAVCARCGCAKDTGFGFCRHCGQMTDPDSTACPSCGCTEEVVVTPTGKSKVAAGILGIFLGGLGIHNFYLGYTGKGVMQLLTTLISLGTLSFISSVWGIVEGIMILTGAISKDAEGNPLV